jgi:hypothetical protein
MKPKTIITAVLLLFVAISVVALIVKESSDAPEAGTGGNAVTSEQLPDDRLIVYYFHGNVRCPTCNTLEAYSKEAVETLFPDELNSDRVEFQVVNYDESWNEHFLADYDLSFQSLVLVEMKDGKEVRFANLDKIWDLVGDKAAYFEYVRNQIDTYLAAE